jgi:hypothetical protein
VSTNHEHEDIGKQIEHLSARVDDIVAFQKRKSPWYRDTAVLISVCAFFLSIATGGISAYRTYREDINSRRDSLRAVIQQFHEMAIGNVSTQYSIKKDMYGLKRDMATLNGENTGVRSPGNNGIANGEVSTTIGSKDVERDGKATSVDNLLPPLNLRSQYNLDNEAAGDAESAAQATGNLLNSANVSLASKALSIVSELGCKTSPQKNSVIALSAVTIVVKALIMDDLGCHASSIDESEVGYMLMVANQLDLAEKLYNMSEGSASNSLEYLAAVRGLAQVQFATGNKAGSEESMKSALGVFDKFPGEAPTKDYINLTEYSTYIMWATMIGASDCTDSTEKLEEANTYSNLFSHSLATAVGTQSKINKLKMSLLQQGCTP